jgi:hypothetical protein
MMANTLKTAAPTVKAIEPSTSTIAKVRSEVRAGEALVGVVEVPSFKIL